MSKDKPFDIEFAFKTNSGKVRLSNQDNVRVVKNKFNEVLMIVADGMGGYNKGDYASKLCVDFVIEKFINRKRKFKSKFIALVWLRYIVYKCNSYIYKISEEQSNMHSGMGTTVVIALLIDNYVVNINVGDSRAYIVSDSISLLSEDQSYVKYLEHSGQISREEAEKREDNNLLLSALGLQPSTNQNVKTIKYNGESILLCSDGLFHVLKDEEIFNIVKQDKNINLICDELIETANNYGGPDNISVALLRRKL